MSSTTSTSRPVHLTRRGRVVVLLALVAVVFAGVSLLRTATDTATADAGTVQVLVEQGDTLWEVAQRHAPESDPREVIAEIGTLNDLSRGLRAGQLLTLPA